MHLIYFENEEERELNFNKFENLFCPMEKLEKKTFIEKWKSLTKEVKFTIGKLYSNKESSVVKRLQAYHIMGSALKTVVPEKVINLYMSCTTKNNILILFELTLIKSNHLYAEIKYKSESLDKENDFENFMTIVLSDGGVEEDLPDISCR